MASLTDRLDEAVAKAHLEPSHVARAVDTNPRTVVRWLAGESSPRPAARERLLELIAVIGRLSGVLEPQAAHDWFFTPSPLLQNQKPIDLLTKGRYRDVLGAVDALAEGVFI